MAFLMDADRAHGFAAVNTHSFFHEGTRSETSVSPSRSARLDPDPEIISFCAGPGAEARTAHTAQ